MKSMDFFDRLVYRNDFVLDDVNVQRNDALLPRGFQGNMNY